MGPADSVQLSLPLPPARSVRGGVRPGAGRKRRGGGRPNVAHTARPVHKGRFPVHVTMRTVGQVSSLRQQLVRKTLVAALRAQSRRAYATTFQVVHFSIQDDHLHLIVEAGAGSRAPLAEEREALRRGISGLAISLARRLNRLLKRRGKLWADRHHRRDLESPSQVRNTLVYVLQNHAYHGTRSYGAGLVDAYSTAHDFDGWLDPLVVLRRLEPWRPPVRTWLLRVGWRRAGGPIATTDFPKISPSVRHAEILRSYVPDASFDGSR